jgi:hypothetical protein
MYEEVPGEEGMIRSLSVTGVLMLDTNDGRVMLYDSAKPPCGLRHEPWLSLWCDLGKQTKNDVRFIEVVFNGDQLRRIGI